MRHHNSTIKIKQKTCIVCGKSCVWFSRKRCQQCAKIQDNKDAPEEMDEDLSGLIADADALFSRWIRLKYSDKNGECKCYTCQTKLPKEKMQCGHYISRKHSYLRLDERNARVQCEVCNCIKHGNLSEYGKRLEIESSGITEILLEESRIIHKFGRDELRQIISELTQKIKNRTINT